MLTISRDIRVTAQESCGQQKRCGLKVLFYLILRKKLSEWVGRVSIWRDLGEEKSKIKMCLNLKVALNNKI